MIISHFKIFYAFTYKFIQKFWSNFCGTMATKLANNKKCTFEFRVSRSN